MIAIVGLGNIGKEYENTHHNVGFMAVDELANSLGLTFQKNKYEGIVAETIIAGEKVIILKPHTYMNLSGNAVSKMMKMTNTPITNLIIVYDDIDLPLGKIRVRANGSAGTHNGMRNIISCLGTSEFIRVRIGIGKNENMDLATYVLSKFSMAEKAEINKSINEVVKIITLLINNHCNINEIKL